MDLIKSAQTWVIRTGPILDVNGARLTGLTDIKFSVSRYTGGAWQWLDTADMTFRASPAGYQFTMTAVDATKVAGVYGYALDTSTITNVAFGDRLFIDIQQTTLTNAVNANQAGEGTYGYVIDKVEDNLTVATSALATTAQLGPLALEATLTAMKGATFDTLSDSLEALRNRGDAAWITATGFATPTNVTDARDAIEAYGDLHWTTAVGFAVPGSAMTLAADAITAATIAAGAIGASEAPLLANLDAAVSTRLATASYAAAPTAADNATAVWAKVYGTPDAGTFGWMLYRLGQWGTELCQKRIVGQNLLLQSIGGGTTYATVPLKDADNNAITPAVGEPAQFLPT